MNTKKSELSNSSILNIYTLQLSSTSSFASLFHIIFHIFIDLHLSVASPHFSSTSFPSFFYIFFLQSLISNKFNWINFCDESKNTSFARKGKCFQRRILQQQQNSTMQYQLATQWNVYVHQVQTCGICCTKQYCGSQSSYYILYVVMDQASKHDQHTFTMEWHGLQFKLQENYKLSQGGRPQYFFLRSSH